MKFSKLLLLLPIALIACNNQPEPVAIPSPLSKTETPAEQTLKQNANALEKSEPSSASTASPDTIPSPNTVPNKSAETKETSIGADVSIKGLDFSYNAPGRIEEHGDLLILTHLRTWDCSPDSQVSTARQEHQTILNLSTNKWTSKVREMSTCLGNPAEDWMDNNDTPSQFTIQQSGNEATIKADVQDYDGSIIVKDAIVVKYRAAEDRD